MLAIQRQTENQHPQTLDIPRNQSWSTPSNIINNNNLNNIFSFGVDQPLFDYQPTQFASSSPQPLMQADQNNTWLSNGQLTPTSTTRAHHRESSLSSYGSAGPASPYTVNSSNPQVAGDIYHEFQDFHHPVSKPITPIHTPLQENFIPPPYPNYYQNSPLNFSMAQDGLPKQMGNAELMPAAEIRNGRRSMATVASESSSTPQSSYEDEKHKNGYRAMPKLDRTMTDIYADELYNPSIQFTSAAPSSNTISTTPVSPQNDIFSQRLQTAASQHLTAPNTQSPLLLPSRGDRSPFRQGSPLAPTGTSYSTPSSNLRFGTATHLREQQKAANDARALQQQIERTSPVDTAPKTISPKEVALVYHETEEDSKVGSLFRPQQLSPNSMGGSRNFRTDIDETASSQQSYGSMATTRRESSSYSNSSQPQHMNYGFGVPAVTNRQIPQQYPFVPQTQRQSSNLSGVSEDFPASLAAMESSSSEFTPASPVLKKPAGASADTGTYTCTYHGCTLRFDTPAKLQRHKREGHRNSATVGSGADEGGMTSAAQRNSQAGPHKCERINPSTGKPCNTIFSRPYDLTRHEDTIHNARKLKVHCPLCTEEKTFSRNDALTRHLRVVHPEHVEMNKSRRRAHD
ncbi:hypothetical protein HYALB_00004246 [Hymenoscyphus albidus]|uniref:C2H2-type domain-containing protein n=1 Tax=Hymenoscyphus albidus TaxID=595503 RepID=A0A9N9LGV0_9HELO|nr:hypothetical protein HYALB_00004246 [Hymenoscyphus albidus]